jgi:hypothetical protein
MSLTDWVEWDKGLFDCWFTKPKFGIKAGIRAKSLTKNFGGVGTAFDYVFRLMINKKYPKYVKGYLVVAETVVNSKKRKSVIEEFFELRNQYLNDKLEIEGLINHCLALSKLDTEFRSGYPAEDDKLLTNSHDDVKDIKNLISVLNIDIFKTSNRCILNPTFGKSSKDIGGADADILLGNSLIDIKTSNYLTFEPEYFRQLMGYYILNVRTNNVVGVISHLGIYYARFGILFLFNPKDHEYSHNVFCSEKELEKYWTIDGKNKKDIDEDVKIDLETQRDFWKEVEESINEYQKSVINSD